MNILDTATQKLLTIEDLCEYLKQLQRAGDDVALLIVRKRAEDKENKGYDSIN